MEKASRVMYTIANIFNWIIAILSLAGIVLSILSIAHVLPENDYSVYLGVTGLVCCILTFLVALATIFLVRIAKSKKSSKGWDVLFIVLGVLDGNVFYILGGIFGLLAVKRD